MTELVWSPVNDQTGWIGQFGSIFKTLLLTKVIVPTTEPVDDDHNQLL